MTEHSFGDSGPVPSSQVILTPTLTYSLSSECLMLEIQSVPFDKVRMYEEIMMTNTDNLQSSLLTSIY